MNTKILLIIGTAVLLAVAAWLFLPGGGLNSLQLGTNNSVSSNPPDDLQQLNASDSDLNGIDSDLNSIDTTSSGL